MELQAVLVRAVAAGASDLHLSAGQPPWLRVAGDLQPLAGSPVLGDGDVQLLLDQAFTAAQRQTFRNGSEVDCALGMPGVGRFRINAYRQRRGASAVFRVIPATVPALADLDLPPALVRLVEQPHGLILVTGPTGSGKSTTLAAILDHYNRTRAAHLLTLEDPVEFVHAPQRCLISQREVGQDTAGFAPALRAALREDPDIVMVGELRDLETVRLALTAAETGHLVLGTLHTGSAARSIERIVDVFPAGEKSLARSLLAESLRLVVSQLLLPCTGGGRVGVHEVMVVTPAIRHLIREDKGAQIYSAIQTGQAAGMQTLDQALLQRMASDRLAAGVARRVAREPGLFA